MRYGNKDILYSIPWSNGTWFLYKHISAGFTLDISAQFLSSWTSTSREAVMEKGVLEVSRAKQKGPLLSVVNHILYFCCSVTIFVDSNKVFIFSDQALNWLCLFPANRKTLKSIPTAQEAWHFHVQTYQLLNGPKWRVTFPALLQPPNPCLYHYTKTLEEHSTDVELPIVSYDYN